MARVYAEERQFKRERVAENDGDTVNLNGDDSTPTNEESKRRIIRSHYREIEHRIAEEKDELAKATSNKFLAILNEVDNMHQHVTRPRELVSDAETLLGLASTLTASVKSHSHGGFTPTDFISCLLRLYEKRKGPTGSSRNAPNILWKDIGSIVSPFIRAAPRCMTMTGPMESEMRIRKTCTRRRHAKPVGNARPEEVQKAADAVTDTDKNMEWMFSILIENRKKVVKLENLILNRYSFAQTVENLFALSFLVHKGRVKINVDGDGSQIVVPTKHAPRAEQREKGEVKNSHFIFRFDFGDWKLMKNLVVDGEELMPHRDAYTTEGHGQAKAGSNDDEGINIPEAIPINSQILNPVPLNSVPLKAVLVEKYSRNYGCDVKPRADLAGVATVASLSNWNGKRKRAVF